MRHAALIAGALCASVEALGQESPAPVRLPEVTVTATRVEEDSFDLPVAIDRVDRREIREDRPQVNLSEPLNRVPGVVVQNRQNYAQDLQVSSRGFGARATFGVRGVRLTADGIPATMPDGQGQTATFDLGSADRIEVLRGPFSTLYGNASGGVIQVFTAVGPPEPTITGGVNLGSYDPATGLYQTVATINGPRFGSDVEVAGGAVYVAAAAVLITKLGSAVLFTLVIFGQLVTAVVMDHFGLIGLEKHPISAARIVGILLVLAGVVIVRQS